MKTVKLNKDIHLLESGTLKKGTLYTVVDITDRYIEIALGGRQYALIGHSDIEQ